MKFLTALFALTLATSAYAQEFTVSLGAKKLGTLTFTERGATAVLESTLNQTPMGVFNGTFVGTSKSALGKASFTGKSQSSRKQRLVSVEYKNNRVESVEITPLKEMTDLSDPARVSPSVIDPVRVIAALLGAKGCPSAITLYDGRREVQIAPTGEDQGAEKLTCRLSYKVAKGPGHLSPLKISTAKMQLQYDIVGGAQTLKQIKISSGVFRLSLNRTQ